MSGQPIIHRADELICVGLFAACVGKQDQVNFDWDNSGNADHVGIVIGTDGTNVYTVEGNSGNACKIKSYPLNSSVIRGYGLMNWD